MYDNRNILKVQPRKYTDENLSSETLVICLNLLQLYARNQCIFLTFNLLQHEIDI